LLTLQQLSAELGTPQANAGRITGQGHWSPAEWALDAKLVDVRPSLLDARRAVDAPQWPPRALPAEPQ